MGDQGQLLHRLVGALQTWSNLAGPAVLELPVGKTAASDGGSYARPLGREGALTHRTLLECQVPFR